MKTIDVIQKFKQLKHRLGKGALRFSHIVDIVLPLALIVLALVVILS